MKPLTQLEVAWLKRNKAMSGASGGIEVEPAGQRADSSVGEPNQCANPSASQPSESIDQNAGQPSQSVNPASGPTPQSGDPNADQPNQCIDANASQSNQSTDPNADQLNQCVDPNVGQPNQSEGPSPGQPNQSAPAKDNSTSGRVMRAIDIAATQKLGGAVGAKLRELATPANLAVLMAFVGLYIAAQATPAGWVADGIAIVTLVASAMLIGKELSGVIDEVRAFIGLCENPNGDLDAAAQHLANAATTVGIDVLLAIILHKAGGAAKPYIKPPTGMVEMVTDTGLIVQVPAEAVQAASLGRPAIPPVPLHMEGDPNNGDRSTQSNGGPSPENTSCPSQADTLRSQHADALTKGSDSDYNILVDDANEALSGLDKAEADYRSSDTTDPSIVKKHQALEDARAAAENNLNELNREYQLRSSVQPGASVYDSGRILYNNGQGIKSISAWESSDGPLSHIQQLENLRDAPQLGQRTDLGDWWNGASDHYLVNARNGSLMDYDVIRSRINGKELWSWIRTTHTAR
jgi:hypothetical protein